jgi:hypothetical protein
MLKDFVGTEKLPGKIAPIGFDAHVENAGTVHVGKDADGHSRSIQTLIDVDDSGVGPAGVDALSIGIALEQAGFGHKVMKQAYAAFAEAAVEDQRGPREVAGPKWGKLRRAWLAKNTKTERRNGEQQLSFKGMTRASPKLYAAVAKAATRRGVLAGYEVLDIARDEQDSGGSDGILELEMLARDRKTDRVHVFVLKQQDRPGADELGIKQPSDRTRLALIERGLWKDVPANVLFYLRDVKLPGEAKMDLLVRDKLAMVDEVASGKDAAQTAVDVARLYGHEHAGQFGNMSAPELARWMGKSTHAVTDGFEQLWSQLKAEKTR